MCASPNVLFLGAKVQGGTFIWTNEAPQWYLENDIIDITIDGIPNTIPLSPGRMIPDRDAFRRISDY